MRLREQIVKANLLVREANYIAEELDKRTEYKVTLQIPASSLDANRKVRWWFVPPQRCLGMRWLQGSPCDRGVETHFTLPGPAVHSAVSIVSEQCLLISLPRVALPFILLPFHSLSPTVYLVIYLHCVVFHLLVDCSVRLFISCLL